MTVKPTERRCGNEILVLNFPNHLVANRDEALRSSGTGA